MNYGRATHILHPGVYAQVFVLQSIAVCHVDKYLQYPVLYDTNSASQMSVRAISGIFVWAIESTVLALLAVSTIYITQAFGGNKLLAAEMWVLLVILFSCVGNIATQVLVAMCSKQGTISNGSGYLHKSVAQAHCCVVSLMLVMYIIIMQQSLVDLNWANAYYTAAPGLVWLTGSITLAYVTVLWMTSIAGAWTATAVGDYNSLFCTLPTTSMACIMYPIVHEVGNSGLMVCTSAFVSTISLLYVNLAIASSFALSVLDRVEFDPANILPKFMRTVGDKMPTFRVYSLIHGICISTALIVYTVFARNINLVAVIVLLSMNVLTTITTSIGAGRFLASSLGRTTGTSTDTSGPDDSVDATTDIAVETVTETGDDLTTRQIAMLRLDDRGRRRIRASGQSLAS
jgi:hypothetical protein